MPLRLKITAKTINDDKTLTVSYDLAWADATGTEVWTDSRQQAYAGDVTSAQVLSDLRQIGDQAAGLVAASVALDIYIGKTFERESDGSWTEL